MSDAVLISADARRLPLADESVQCIVTSPPYWGLRKYAGEQELIWGSQICYTAETGPHPEHEWQEERRNGISGGQNQNCKAENGDGATNRPVEPSTHGTCARCGAWRGAYGLEPTVEMYVAHSLEILRELRRVLRKDGVLFWNLGDSYASTRGYGGDLKPSDLQSSNRGSLRASDTFLPNRHPQAGLKHKDLVLMPARIALAAQADVSVRNGKEEAWWVRSVIVWAKPNPMPESVTDRPTVSYEHILMLTKSARYFWDADAVREKAETGWNGSSFTDERDKEVYPNLGTGPRNAFGYTPKGTHSRGNGDGGPKARERAEEGTFKGWADGTREVLGSRNLRNVWMFPTQPYAGPHFATFPEELPRRCILAATSARGACTFCGAPWERILEKKAATMNIRVRDAKRGVADADEGYPATETETANYGREEMGESRTVGWSPTCRCRGQHGKTVGCIVLDPFAGSGTTGRVAIELNRRAVLCDLAYGRATDEDRAKKREYDRLAQRRLSEVQRTLPLL